MITNESEASTAAETAAPEPKRKTAKKPEERSSGTKKASPNPKAERASKKTEVIALMKRTKGATLAEIMKATAWQAHTVRGFVSILGTMGMKTESSRNDDGVRTYKIAI